MVKQRFTSLDVRAMVLSLQQTLLGYRVANVYDINPKTYLLKLAKPCLLYTSPSPRDS